MPEKFPNPNNENFESKEEFERALESVNEFFELMDSLSDVEDLEVTKDLQYSFLDREAREVLFEGFYRISEYIHKEKIANILILDRSARGAYVGIKECYSQLYPNDPQPKVYFINPRGFDLENFDQTPMALRMPLFAKDELKHDRIDKRFEDVFHHLAHEKDKPLLVFDTCIHTGKAICPVLASLKRQEFENVHVGVYSNAPDNASGVNVDVEMVPKDRFCYPFGRADLVKANYDVVSVKQEVNDSTEYVAKRLRYELKQVVHDGLKEMGKLRS